MRAARCVFTLLLLCLGGFSPKGGSDPLSPILHYRKIKFRLTGRDPSAREYQNFKVELQNCAQNVECINGYLRLEAWRFMQSPRFVARAIDFSEALLFLPALPVPAEWNHSLGYFAEDNSQRPFADLVKRIFSQNLPWDEFFTASQFEIPNDSYSSMSDLRYFIEFISKDQKPPVHFPIRVQVQDLDLAAGFIITPEFNGLYPNNPVNEGRKRAAAVLRIALCDSMFPAIDRGAETERIEDKIARGYGVEQMQKDLDKMRAQEHGRRKDCAKCHVDHGLDHLAWTFRSTEMILSSPATPGRLTFVKTNGESFDQPVRGIGHYTRLLVAQPEFEQCQVRHFWQAFGGEGAYLDRNPEFLRRLVRAFNDPDHHHRVQDFLVELVMQPEFSQESLGVQGINSIFAKSAKVLVNCDRCHGWKMPSFTQLPIGLAGADETEKYMDQIIDHLGLDPWSRKERVMPPATSAWQPSADQLASVRDWIAAGAPGPDGKRYLSEAWLKAHSEGRTK